MTRPSAVEFTANTKAKAARRDGGRCQICTRKVGIGGEKAEFDHYPVSVDDGGDNSLENCRTLCAECHRQYTGKQAGERATARRHQKRALGIGKTVRRPLPGSRGSGLRKRMDGTVWRE